MGRLLPGLGPDADRLLRESLRVLAGHSPDPRLRDVVEEVLAGTRPLGDLMGDDALRQHIADGLPGIEREWIDHTPQERAEIADQARRR